ncbi:ZN140 protein, partial [Scytalopus superciliaris]|nr:ZN140 protein [Scytalopus superciliaris]
CREGGRSLSWYPDLVVHVQFQPREKPYMCLECEKSFSQVFQLFLHQREHMGE